jgi:hypothetical protein
MDIPIFDLNSEDGKTDLELALNSSMSSSDYRNDRERPYNGQKHTTHGERGKTEIKGLTFRDIRDCIVQGFLISAVNDKLYEKVSEIDKDMIGTEYEKKNTWRESDLYKIDFDDVDPVAILQNTMLFIEHYMGIYPNVEPFDFDDFCRSMDD